MEWAESFRDVLSARKAQTNNNKSGGFELKGALLYPFHIQSLKTRVLFKTGRGRASYTALLAMSSSMLRSSVIPGPRVAKKSDMAYSGASKHRQTNGLTWRIVAQVSTDKPMGSN